jgi:membrane protein required for colicin V production
MLTADAVILSLVFFFASWGAVTGAARQIAQLVSIGAGVLVSSFLTEPIAPSASRILNISPTLGFFLTQCVLFIGTVFLIRFSLTGLLQRALSSNDAKSRAPDRWLGFLLGGMKAAAVCYAVVSAIVFVQENVHLRGLRLETLSRKSYSYRWVKAHNLFDLTPPSNEKG